jgi:hypothetical protein
VAGADPDFGGLKLIQFLGSSARKRMQNYECRIKCETDSLLRMRKEITTSYKFKDADNTKNIKNSEQ